MRIKNDLVLRHIGDDYLVVDPWKGMVDMTNVYTLNETAAWLWQQLEHKDFALSQVVELLLERYDVQRELAEQDAYNLMRLFKGNGLLQDDDDEIK
ncbi:MAG: PqqD family protein [Bacteroides sp.]|jgi:hypothetical protein|nr:PqqD family protein [Bacteroides sp.]MCI1684040.1 PqqD family protein [Bacteroides sp.]